MPNLPAISGAWQSPSEWVCTGDGSLIEVMTYIGLPHDAVVFHCMQLRDKFRRLMKGKTQSVSSTNVI